MKEHGDPPRVEGPGGASALARHCLLGSLGGAAVGQRLPREHDKGGRQPGRPPAIWGTCRENLHRVPSLPIPASPGTDSSIAPDPIPSSAASIRRGSGASAINSSCASVGRQLSIHSLVAPVRQLVSLASASALRCPQPAAQHRPDEARSPADEATTFAIPIASVPSFDEISPTPTSRGRPQLSPPRAAPKQGASRERRPGTAALQAQDLPTPGIPDDGADGLVMQKGLGWNPPTTARSTVRAKAAAEDPHRRTHPELDHPRAAQESAPAAASS